MRGSKCQAHIRAYDQQRGSSAQRGYDAEWRKLRDSIIDANPFCVVDGKPGYEDDPLVVDHTVPISAGGARLDPSNLQPMHASCHSRKTALEDGRWGGP